MSTESSLPKRRDFLAGLAAAGLLCNTPQAPANDNVSRSHRVEIPEDVLADLRRRL
jgi:hypothetical protein